MYITLKEAREHLNITDEFFTDDDRYILSLIAVAEDAVEKRLDRSLGDCVDSRTGELAPAVRQSVLLLIGTFYNQREATSVQNVKEVPLTFGFLSDLYRKHSVG